MLESNIIEGSGKGNQPQMNSIRLDFGLSSFENAITSNFKLITAALESQQKQITALKRTIESITEGKQMKRGETIANIVKTQQSSSQKGVEQSQAQSNLLPNQQQYSQMKAMIKVNEDKAHYKAKDGEIHEETNEKQKSDKPKKQQQRNINTERQKQVKINKSQQNVQRINKNNITKQSKPIVVQQNSPIIQKTPIVDESSNKINDLIYSKISELFDRMTKLQITHEISSSQNVKKFYQIQLSLQNSASIMQKSDKNSQHFEQLVDQLRSELQQYKIKSQGKRMKAMNSSMNQSNNSSNDNYDYIAQKIQFLLKHVRQMQTKRAFEQERELIESKLKHFNNKIKDLMSKSQLDGAIIGIQQKIARAVQQFIQKVLAVKKLKPQNQGSTDNNNQEGNVSLQYMILNGNKHINQNQVEHTQLIKQIQEEVQTIKAELEMTRKQKLQFQEDINEEIKNDQENIFNLQCKYQQVQNGINELKQSADKQHLEVQNQIIQAQENIQKITNQIKSINYTRTNNLQLPKIPQLQSTQSQQQPGSVLTILQKSNTQFNPEMENDLVNQKKKISKLTSKVQGLKEEILRMREDLNRQMEGLKMNLQKKADWESLKKALNYFDQKLKQTKTIIQSIYQNMGKSEGGDPLVVKKSWTCLVCDKDIRNYQGKLGDVKFTSIFPVRESPRIGGYFKQQQNSQQYKQVFMSNNNSNSNNRSRRITSLKPNQSREQLH